MGFNPQTDLDLYFFNFFLNPTVGHGFQSKALRMIVDAPWYVPNTLSGETFKFHQLRKKLATTAPITALSSLHTP
jgi:hypothetical protein